ncbi:hypothetical protein GNI_197490, partial [Gregarina niphandrodes]
MVGAGIEPIRTDESLRLMRNCDKGRIARWNSSLDEFDLQIIYSKGKENQVAVVSWSGALGRGAVGPDRGNGTKIKS